MFNITFRYYYYNTILTKIIGQNVYFLKKNSKNPTYLPDFHEF